MKRDLDTFIQEGQEKERQQQRAKVGPDDERLRIFEQWLDDQQVIREHIVIRQFAHGKGYALYSSSSTHLPRIEIPLSVLMKTEDARKSSTFVMPSEEILAKTDDHIDRDTLILSLFLLHERAKGPESHWYPYIQLLPESFSTPLFHSENYLEYTSVFYLAQTQTESMQELCDLIGLEKSSFKDFLWAYTAVGSRAFQLTALGTVLIPFADLANHVCLRQKASLKASGIDPDSHRFVLTAAPEMITAEEELNIQYHELPNWQLLLSYGFTIEKNPFDSIIVELKMDPDESHETEMKKMLLFNLCDDLSLEHELQIKEDEPIISEELLASLRLVIMSDDELKQYSITNIDELFTKMVNPDNERRGLNKLKAVLHDISEANFTTTLEENLERLKSTDLSDDERYSLIYLVGQKRIIDRACSWIADALSQLP